MTLMTIREVSLRIRRHRNTVGRLVRTGQLEAVKGEGRNGRVLITPESVHAYLERNKVQPETTEMPPAAKATG